MPTESISFRESEGSYIVVSGEQTVVRLMSADAEIEQVPLPVLAKVTSLRIIDAIGKYREDRTPSSLKRSGLYTAGFTLVLVLMIWLLRRVRRWLERIVRQRVDSGMANLERKSGSAVHRGQLWSIAQGLLQLFWLLTLVVIAYFYLSSVLGTFPWTRSIALVLIDYVKSPLVSMGNAFIRSIPDLIFLVVLWFVIRYVLRTLKIFFRTVETGRVRLNNFEPEWATPTYRLLRLAVIAFGIIVAYPYIPGSESAAFKGVSLFLGVIVSLGSTSFIANLIAGTALTYRGVFREGDWVKIDDAEGRVEEIRAQVVRIRKRGGERVSVPSSTILNANVTNLSDQVGQQGLVLRCPVSIGYDISWETAESLLLEAAAETEGVLSAPAPRVQTDTLGEFAVTHILLARISDPEHEPAIQTRLNRAVLDRFHHAGIQIMSPAYENDPPEIKIPPKEQAGD